MITWNTDVNAPGCPGEIVNDDGQTLLIQTDWDYPGVASTFGWSLVRVQVEKCPECGEDLETLDHDDNSNRTCEACERIVEQCEHDSTDGSVTCDKCGLTAGDFISAAYDWLVDNDGATVEDPGYFQGDDS